MTSKWQGSQSKEQSESTTFQEILRTCITNYKVLRCIPEENHRSFNRSSAIRKDDRLHRHTGHRWSTTNINKFKAIEILSPHKNSHSNNNNTNNDKKEPSEKAAKKLMKTLSRSHTPGNKPYGTLQTILSLVEIEGAKKHDRRRGKYNSRKHTLVSRIEIVRVGSTKFREIKQKGKERMEKFGWYIHSNKE